MGFVGVDIGGTRITAGWLDGSTLTNVMTRRHVEAEDRVSTEAALVRRIREVVHAVAGAAAVDGVGLSVSGFRSADRARVSNDLLGLHQSPLAAEVAADLDRPVIMENDGNCATWAEYVTQPGGRAADPFLMLTLGTGVGGGIIAGGQILHGHHSLATELGHLSIDPGGWRCPCGGIGCLEMYASGRALIRAYMANLSGAVSPVRNAGTPALQAGAPVARAGAVPPSIPEGPALQALEAGIAAGLAEGDTAATVALGCVGAAIARGLLLLARTIDPGMVVIGGGLSAIGPPLLDAIQAGVRSGPGLVDPLADTPIVLARYGNLAGALGVALLAEQRIPGPGRQLQV